MGTGTVGHTERSPTAVTRKAPAWRLISGGICWLATLEFFAAQAIAQAAWTGSDYSLAGNPISDLGVTACGRITIAGQSGYYCSPLHGLMNASFAATGVLMLLGLCLTRPAWPDRRLARWGIALFTLAGIGKVVVGLEPANVNYGLHSLGGLDMILANAAVILLGAAVRETGGRWIVRLSAFLGILGLTGEVLFFAHRALGGGAGAAERIADYPVFAWMIVLGVCCVCRVHWSRHSGSSAARRVARAGTVIP
jgi:hypothetical membrane protein